MRRIVLLVFLVAAGAALGVWWWVERPDRSPPPFALYGNVDFRQAQLAFNNNERIARVLAQEGERVRAGQVLASLDASRLEPRVAQAKARVAAQRHVVEKLHHGSRPQEIAQSRAQVAAQRAVVEKLRNGSRPEEIAQASANVDAARAEAANGRRRYERLKKLSDVRLADRSQVQGVSQEELDDARAALEESEAKLTASQKALELLKIGPRKEEIAEAEARLALSQHALELAIAGPRAEEVAQAEAELKADEAELSYMKQQLADTQLKAPSDAVVRTRLLEPGEMSSPQRPVFSLAITDPKWVRVYVSEPDLGKVRSGTTASVSVDSFPGRHFDGWVGFISPVAEFTPKAVQTEELRTSLVYEVRVFVSDKADELRLGMPATVRLDAPSPRAGVAETGP
jgi:HlyD family secretion protein